MGTKYIIEVEDKPFELLSADGFTSEKLYRVKGFKTLVFDWNILNMLTPYTEPDLGTLAKENFERGYRQRKAEEEKEIQEAYQRGLEDAWEAVGKICNMCSDVRHKIFKENLIRKILSIYSASEAIEKIRQYEQEKEEIKVGDEVKSGNERYVVLQKYLNNIDEPMAVLFNRRDGEISYFHLYNGNGVIFEKTGRHFPEIAEVLQKMKER